MGQLLLMTLGMLFAVTASSATSGKREFGIFMGFQYYGKWPPQHLSTPSKNIHFDKRPLLHPG